MKLKLRHSLALLTAVGLGTAVNLPLSYAGPDDGKPVATAAHIDSPKIFWNGDNFDLISEFYQPGLDDDYNHPLDSVVHWSGKGYASGLAERQQFMFTVPENQPELGFLGEAGRTWYEAPANPLGNQAPIWIGVGTDANVPVEMFRDGMISLDMVSVKGPGKMEMTRKYADSNNVYHINRMFSSTDTKYRAYAAPAGTHTHNATLFSRPGRYEITYQASARKLDGTLLQSKPTVQVWQVGGSRPAPEKQVDLETAYAQAPTGTPAVPYVFKAEPLAVTPPGETPDKWGDDLLTRFTFDAGDPNISGTLHLSIQGFHFADIPVQEGKATASYYAGAEDSTIQATFIPAEGSTGYRWRSEGLPFDAKARTLATTSAISTDTPVAEQPEPSTPTDLRNYTPTSMDYTITVTPIDEESYRASIEFKDPKMRGFLTVGSFLPGETTAYSTEKATVGSGSGSVVINDAWIKEGMQPRVEFIAHPSINAPMVTVNIDSPVPVTKEVVVHGTLSATPAPTAPDTTPEPTTPEPEDNNNAPEKPANPEAPYLSCLGDRKPLSDGHVDITASLTSPEDGATPELTIGLKDDTRQIEPESKIRDLNTVAFIVDDKAMFRRGEKQKDPSWDFLGKMGDVSYVLPADQQEGRIWPGWSTEHIDYSKVNGNVRLALSSYEGPGRVQIALPGQLNDGPTKIFDTNDKNPGIDNPVASHKHAFWSFDKPGVYKLGFRYETELTDGTKLKSPEQVLLIVVGSETTCATEQPNPDENNSESAGNKPVETDKPTPDFELGDALITDVDPNTPANPPAVTKPAPVSPKAPVAVAPAQVTPKKPGLPDTGVIQAADHNQLAHPIGFLVALGVSLAGAWLLSARSYQRAKL